jgi:hypothetical protein
VNTSLSGLHRRNQKSNSKEKAVVCMTKKKLLIGVWVGVVSYGQLVIVAVRQTVQCRLCINNRVFVKSFKMPNLTKHGTEDRGSS